MKRTYRILLCVFALLMLTLVFVSCGDNGGDEPPVENEYAYSFTVGVGEDSVELAYVVKTSYQKSQNTTDCEVFARVDGTLIDSRIATCSFSGEEGTINVNGTWELKLENGVLTSVTAPSEYSAIIPANDVLNGTYALDAQSQIPEMSGNAEMDFSLTLNTDGTGTLLEKPLTYYPLDGDSIVILDEDGEGLVLDMNRTQKSYKPQEDSLSFNFAVGTDFANYYKVFFDSERQTRSGEGMFTAHMLHTSGSYFYIEGARWVTGRYENNEGVISLFVDGEADQDAITIFSTDSIFDAARSKSYAVESAGRYLYIYEDGSAYVSTDISGIYEVAKGTTGLDIPAIYDRNNDKTYVYSKTTLDLVATFRGDTYVDISTYKKYTNLAQLPNAELISNIYVSPDHQTILKSYEYTSGGTAIEYENMKAAPQNGRIDFENTLITTNDFCYFLTNNGYFEIGNYDIPQLRDKVSSAVSCTLTKMPVTVTNISYSSDGKYVIPYPDSYVAKICWENSDQAVMYVVLGVSMSDNVPTGAYAIAFYGMTLANDVDGITAISALYDDTLMLVKKVENTLTITNYTFDFDSSDLRYHSNEGDYLTLKDRLLDVYYLINKNTMEFDYIIEDANYEGITGAKISGMAGVENYSQFEIAKYPSFADILYFDSGKFYRPFEQKEYLGCYHYLAVAGTAFPDLMTAMVIQYPINEGAVGYYYINEDGYYPFSLSTALDPSELAAFEKDGAIMVYTTNDDGTTKTLELTKYNHPMGDTYMLLIEYELIDFTATENTATEATLSMTIFVFGTVTETQDGYEISNTLGGAYTITIDGDQATIVAS